MPLYLVPFALTALLASTTQEAAGSATEKPPETPAELDRGRVLAVIGDDPISLEEYKAFLYEEFGTRELRQLISLRLLEREAARLEIQVTDKELEAMGHEQLEILLRRNRGDEAAMRQELQAEGFTPESYVASVRNRTRRRLLAERICLLTRVVTPEAVAERFDRKFGVGGVQVEVRHLFLNSAKLRRELEREGEPPADLTPAVLEARLLARAQELLNRIRRGEDFETLAREFSHDISVRLNGGVIPGYNYRRYGEPLAEAVRAAEVGVPTGPVRSATGIHLVEVLSRTERKLEDERAAIEEELRNDPPTGAEIRDLEIRLRRETPVEVFR